MHVHLLCPYCADEVHELKIEDDGVLCFQPPIVRVGCRADVARHVNIILREHMTRGHPDSRQNLATRDAGILRYVEVETPHHEI